MNIITVSGQMALADLGGGVRDARPPLGVQILSISCSFRENLACSRPPWRVHAPPRENPGSATGWYKVSDRDTFRMARRLIKEEGLLIGTFPDFYFSIIISCRAL